MCRDVNFLFINYKEKKKNNTIKNWNSLSMIVVLGSYIKPPLFINIMRHPK